MRMHDIKASLAENPCLKFNAFSYEWNYPITVPEIGTTVKVNGREVQVTKNLAALLTRFRDVRRRIPDDERFSIPFWIDALCIDQANDEERNHQVGLMRAIYSGAQATLTWLGESEDNGDYAMAIIRNIGTKILEQSLGGDMMAWVEPEQQPELWQRPADGKDSGPLNRFWTALGGLARRSYWARAWVVQEVLLQKNVVIFCGKNIIHYLALNAFPYWLRNIRGKPCPPGIDARVWSHLSTALGWSWMGWGHFLSRSMHTREALGVPAALDEHERHMRWRSWVMRNKSQQETDPRDHLYSVLGFIGDDVLQPDYSLSPGRVFYDFVTTNIRIQRELAMLSHAGHREPGDRPGVAPPMNLFVPSWVPNWDQVSKTSHFYWFPSLTYKADRGWPAVLGSTDQEVPWSIRGNTLVTPGAFVDVVTTSRVCDTSDGSWLSFCVDRAKAQPETPYPSGVPVMQALAHLELRGLDYPDRKPLDPFPDYLTVFKKIFFVFQESLHFTGGMQKDINEALEKLGVSTHDGLFEKLVGKPFKTIARELVGLAPEMLHAVKNLKFPSTEEDPWSSVLLEIAKIFKDLQGMSRHAAFVTSKGYIGWARKGLRSGDRICILPGCIMPVLLRKVDSHYIYLGVCYVERLMHGEAISCARDGTAQVETFHIV